MSARRAPGVAVAVALLCLLPACADPGAAEADRSPVPSQIVAAAPAFVAPAAPDRVELRTAAGQTYLSAALHPEPLRRGGAGGTRLDPLDARPVWWDESGVPGTATTDTVVVVGHNYARTPAPFRALGVVEPGDRVLLRTPEGVLDYAVESVGPLPKGSLLGDHELRKQVAGRLILANCDVRDGTPTDDNYVVVAQLSVG